ncbi:MAG: hypothetical protein NZ958_03115 [Bacteroidia bacterium]|nr:hypothetical protein [Bacteroidia bacterium]MDW8088216.1 hypothetical protein [Bacteroidia bacterium]
MPGLYYHHWGANEVYYPYVHPSLFAKACASWVWVLLLEGQTAAASLPLLVTTWIHPSVGWQVWFFSLPLFLMGRPAQRRLYGLASLAVLSYVGVVLQKSAPAPPQQELWEKVFIHFNAHMHFNPAYFRLSGHILFTLLLLGGLYVAWRQHSPLGWSLGLYGLAMIGYVLNFYFIHFKPAIYAQLPRATVWLKPLGVFLIMAGLRPYLPSFTLSFGLRLLLFGLVGWTVFRLARSEAVGSTHLQLLRWKDSEPFQLGKWVSTHLPDTVLLAAPPSPAGETALIFSQRSSYIWVAPIFQHSQPQLYRQRIQQLYGVDPLEGAANWKRLFGGLGEAYYEALLQNTPDTLAKWGITHVISRSNLCLPYRKLWSGPTLAVWEVPPVCR